MLAVPAQFLAQVLERAAPTHHRGATLVIAAKGHKISTRKVLKEAPWIDAVVRGEGEVVTTKAGAERSASLEIEFADGKLALGARPAKKGKSEGGEQGSLF